MGVEVFCYQKNVLLFQYTCTVDGHVSKNASTPKGYSSKFYKGGGGRGVRSDVQYLTLLYTIFDKKVTPLRCVQEKI